MNKKPTDQFVSKSFKEYVYENSANISPPSGQTISPSSGGKPPSASAQPATSAPPSKPTWKGQGDPLKVGMSVGINSQTGDPIEGEVTQIDTSANGYKVRDPNTGKDEWYNLANLQSIESDDQQGGQQQATDLQRLKELAGIMENASCGATSAGAIASVPAATGTLKRRQQTKEDGMKTEYTPGTAKTVVGDTKPSQASGKLSSTLAANGMPTASRKNNGFKK